MQDVLFETTGLTSVEPEPTGILAVCVSVIVLVQIDVLVVTLHTGQEGALVGTVRVWLTVILLQSTPGLA